MGWGEPKGPSDEMVRRAERLRAADALSRAVELFADRPTTGAFEHLLAARSTYEAMR